MDDELKAVMKKEGDGQHPASHYLVVEDPAAVTTWHLRVRNVAGELDHRLMGAAWAALHGGYRGNVYEGPNKGQAIAKLKRLYASEDMPLPTSKAVVLPGAPEGYVRLGGYGVIFGGKDLQGETFEADTDYWLDKLTRTPPALYQHGKDAKLKRDVIGRATIADPDDIGLWTEAQFALADQYTAALLELAHDGKLGWSSGTAGHLAERSGNKITSWPIVEMSLTPTPAEPRTLGVHEIRSLAEFEPTYKSLMPKDGGEPSAEAEEKAEPEAIEQSESIVIMEANMPEEKVIEQTPDPGAFADAVMAQLTAKMMALPGMDAALNLMPDGKDRPEEKSFADWLVAVQRKDEKRLNAVYATKAALAEDSGATGGYLVPPEYSASILRVAAEMSVVRPYGPTIINMTGREWNVPVLDYTGSTAGTAPQLGGVVATWTEEAGTKTETEPSFRTVKLVYHELSGYTVASNMVRMDAGPTLESMLRELFAEAVTHYEDWAFLQGNGVAKPLGVFNAPCLLTEVAASSTFVVSDAASMLAKFKSRRPNGGMWLMHPLVLPLLIAMADGSGAANNVIWIPNARESLPATLFGKPIVFTDRMPILPAGTSAAQKGGVLLVDWSYYLIGDRAGLQIDFSEHYKFINNQGTWRFTKLVDGQPWLQQAVYMADGANQTSPFVTLSGA